MPGKLELHQPSGHIPSISQAFSQGKVVSTHVGQLLHWQGRRQHRAQPAEEDEDLIVVTCQVIGYPIQPSNDNIAGNYH